MDEDQNDALRFWEKKKQDDVKDSKLKEETPKGPTLAISADSIYYKMNHKNRGRALIFNHYSYDDYTLRKREGSEKDAINVERVLKKLKFEVTVHHDLKFGKIFDVLKTLSKEDHSENDCLVIVAMSHGDGSQIHAKDFPYDVEELWSFFTGDKCPSLAGKPKLFFIQACRGDKLDSGVEVNTRTTIDANLMSNKYVLPAMADILVMYSTSKDHYSFRSPAKGAWFIQCLCSELETYASRYDLLTVLTLVNRKVAIEFSSNAPGNHDFDKKKQIGSIVSSLTRILYFFPEMLDGKLDT